MSRYGRKRIPSLPVIAVVLSLLVGCPGNGPTTPSAPTAAASADPNPQTIGVPITFDGSASHDNDEGGLEIVKWEWDWDNDGAYDHEDGIPTAGHQYDVAGSYYVQLRVTDDEGETDRLDDPLEIVIEGPTGGAPTAIASADPNPQTVGYAVTFDGSASHDNDEEGSEIVQLEWDWDNDGSFDETGAQVDHLWQSEGTYYVQLRVTDDENQTDELDEPLAVIIEGEYLCNSGELIWARSAGGRDKDRGYEIAALSDNSTVVAGMFGNPLWPATFGTGEPNETILKSEGDYDIFIARYHANGTLAWVKRAGGAGRDSVSAIISLSDDSVIVTGSITGSATFGEGEPNETTLNSDYYDTFIARYNPDGTLVWAIFSEEYRDSVYAVTRLSDDSFVITGESEFHEDILVARHNQDGTLAWAKNIDGPGADRGTNITTLSDDSTIVTGFFAYTDEGHVIFGEGEPNETMVFCRGDFTHFMARYNPDGTLSWAKYNDAAVGGIAALSDNSFVTTGSFTGLTEFGEEGEPNHTIMHPVSEFSPDIFVARYNPDGTVAWATHAGGLRSDVGEVITVLSDDRIVVAGFFGGTIYSDNSATFGEGEPNETILYASGQSQDIFIARYNPEGTLGWAKRAGGTSSEYVHSITSLSDDTTVLTGHYYGSPTFGDGEPNETILTSAGEDDAFIARFCP